MKYGFFWECWIEDERGGGLTNDCDKEFGLINTRVRRTQIPMRRISVGSIV